MINGMNIYLRASTLLHSSMPAREGGEHIIQWFCRKLSLNVMHWHSGHSSGASAFKVFAIL